jgi:hypothetical protein
MDPDRPDEWSDQKNRLGRVESGRSTRSTTPARHHSAENTADKTTHSDLPAQPDVYTKTDRRRGHTKGAKRRPARKRGPKPFVPSADQRHVVSVLAGARMTWDELCTLIINPKTGKPITKETLGKAFPEELANGKAKLKKILINGWLDVVQNGQGYDRWRAIEWGLQHINGFRDDAPGVHLNINEDSEQRSLSVEFVMPDKTRLSALDGQPFIEHRQHRAEHQEQPGRQSKPRRIAPSPDDLVLERNDRQPSAWKAKRGGFDSS